MKLHLEILFCHKNIYQIVVKEACYFSSNSSSIRFFLLMSIYSKNAEENLEFLKEKSERRNFYRFFMIKKKGGTESERWERERVGRASDRM